MIIDAFTAQGVHGRDDDLALDHVQGGVVQQRSGAVGAHAAGVWAGVALTE